ncbi:TspO/MBR family protein [Flexibacterium corallicola]|uniref:TspO/MBR family protein n=1 Tax=Flexibacterium corallicola TaxID=3037259 RepID=UPI00286FA00E|nr:TspO/MBR family protein [Pseudovibrio sp. M1P-2-3]
MLLSEHHKKKLKNRTVWSRLFGWALLCYAIASFGGIVTAPAIPTWYAQLTKPFFSPPDWVFAPVWTVLYTMMAFSVWLAQEFEQPQQSNSANAPSKFSAQFLFLIQLALNGVWSWVFFKLQAPLPALGVLISIIFFVVCTLIVFRARQPIAAWFLLPYLFWLFFAATLNAAIVYLN